jgi:hypothetical protein
MNNIPLNVIVTWIISFLAIPLFYLYVKGSNINNKVFVVSGIIFALIIIILFSGRIFNITPINNLNDYIKDHSEGFFGNKNFLSGDVLPNVYFQGTLSLIICGSLSLQTKSYFSYFIIIIALILAPSRFGFLILVTWGSYVFLKKNPLRMVLLIPFFSVLYLILSQLPFGFELFSIFNGGGDGLEVRNGHLESLKNYFSNNPITFFFGGGPGSVFYTRGTGNIQDNIEISQLEYIRKYGIFSFILFNLFYFGPLFSKKKEIYIIGALIMYYITAFSNPVLYSIFAMLFLAYSYVKMYDIESNVQLKYSE